MGKSAKEIADKQIERGVSSTEYFRKGVEGYAGNPIEDALKKNSKRVANLKRSIELHTWENTMGKLTKDDWKRPTLAKADRLATGIEGARGKIENFHNKFKPLRDSAVEAVNAMPDDTPAQRDAKAAEMSKRLRDLKGKWR